jgi:hypothetical protein
VASEHERLLLALREAQDDPKEFDRLAWLLVQNRQPYIRWLLSKWERESRFLTLNRIDVEDGVQELSLALREQLGKLNLDNFEIPQIVVCIKQYLYWQRWKLAGKAQMIARSRSTICKSGFNFKNAVTCVETLPEKGFEMAAPISSLLYGADVSPEFLGAAQLIAEGHRLKEAVTEAWPELTEEQARWRWTYEARMARAHLAEA